MLNRTFHEWVFIRTWIILMRYPIVPYTSILTACYLGANYSQSPARWITTAQVIVGMMLIEVLYIFFIWMPYTRRLKEPAKHPPPSSPTERRALFERCMGTVPDYEYYLRMWFLGAEPSEIRHDNMREFLLWAFFDVEEGSDNKLSPVENYDVEVDEYIAYIEKGLGRAIEPGRGRAKCLRLTIDSIEPAFRTVWWYATMALLDHATHVLLLLNGFEYYAQPREKAIFPPRLQQMFASRRTSAGNLSYWHRPHRSEGLPVVFLHGIGIGLWPYIDFLAGISGAKGKGQTGVIALEILPVCFRLTEPPLGKEVFLEQFKKILDRHMWDKFALVSHSYGSILSTHAMRCPELQARMSRAVLIDPVSILLHLPDVAYNFTRRQPTTANEWQLWYFASTDPGVAHCLGRYFFWRENAIWADELVGRTAESGRACDDRKEARQVTVCLSGLDLIVDSHAVAKYLAGEDRAHHPAWLQGEHGQSNVADPKTGPMPDGDFEHHRSAGLGINILWFPNKDHAQVFDSPRGKARITAAIRGES
ncbi:uncharacterized protein ColSpa_01587 [Colletotrichum spaethianum]|uniref:Alpha beta hydrolase fold family n=1 Tax=Colletotrichum spaethianum TaxID=700344 RepID=A0AA37P4J9_9PEZI|nr:uncharacterized protein ColSpa_01587 [Colletotrichum spaethianum]GKT41406.1 hypothetical protein ColSpa_01587 [Colletotrichum spaethianum]